MSVRDAELEFGDIETVEVDSNEYWLDELLAEDEFGDLFDDDDYLIGDEDDWEMFEEDYYEDDFRDWEIDFEDDEV